MKKRRKIPLKMKYLKNKNLYIANILHLENRRLVNVSFCQ